MWRWTWHALRFSPPQVPGSDGVAAGQNVPPTSTLPRRRSLLQAPPGFLLADGFGAGDGDGPTRTEGSGSKGRVFAAVLAAINGNAAGEAADGWSASCWQKALGLDLFGHHGTSPHLYISTQLPAPRETGLLHTTAITPRLQPAARNRQ